MPSLPESSDGGYGLSHGPICSWVDSMQIDTGKVLEGTSDMRSNYMRCVLIMSLSLCCGGKIASAQTPPAGQPHTPASSASHGSVKLDMEPSLIVMNARGASLQGQILTLNGVSPNSIVFADRPVRAAGHALTDLFA